MNSVRPLGIKIIAVILFVDSAILVSFALASYCLPGQIFEQIQGFFSSIPYFKNLPLQNDPWTIFTDLLLGLWAALKGVGILRMWRWVRMLIVIDLAFRVGDFALYASLSDQQELAKLLSNPEFVLGSIINLMVLLYLLGPNVKEAFAKHDAA